MTKQKKHDIIYYSVMAAWPILQFSVFYVAVNINSVALSFQKFNAGLFEWNGLVNYKDVFESLSILGEAFVNSFLLYVISLLCGTVPALIFSYYIYKKRLCSKFFQTLLFMPSIISAIVMVSMYSAVIDGVLANILHKNTLLFGDSAFAYIIFYNIWVGFGVNVLLYAGAMSGISDSVIEAASLDGASPLCEFIRIVIPSIYGTLSTFLITGIANIFINQANLYAFYGRRATDLTIGYYLYVQVDIGYENYGRMAAMGVLLTIIVVPVTLLVRKGLEALGPSEE